MMDGHAVTMAGRQSAAMESLVAELHCGPMICTAVVFERRACDETKQRPPRRSRRGPARTPRRVRVKVRMGTTSVLR